MATRSTIAVKHEDGTVSQIYCHWDGYLSHNGRLLAEHYNTPLAVEFLVSKGDLSVLAERVTPNKDAVHNFKVAQNGVCVYYGRDRGEEDTAPRTFATVGEFLDGRQQEEFNYYFNGESWEVEWNGDFLLLTQALSELAEEQE